MNLALIIINHLINFKQVFINKEIIIHDYRISLSELVYGFDIVFNKYSVLFFKNFAVTKSVYQQKYKHTNINKVAFNNNIRTLLMQ